MFVVRTAAFVLAIVVSSGTAAWGQPKTDVVRLLNGDRITGEITELNRGRLEFKTDDSGTIQIEWDVVASVESTRQFEVETSDGRRVLGSLAPSVGEVQIVTIDGPVTLPMVDVTRITPIGRSFWAKLDGSVDAGFTYTESSGIAQLTLNSNTLYRRPAFQFRLASSATITQRSDGVAGDDRAALEFEYINYRRRRLFVAGSTTLESNESLGLLLRTQLGGFVGLRLVNTNRAQTELGGGLVVNDEQAVDSTATQNLEGAASIRTSFYTYDRPTTEFDASLRYFPSLSNWGRQRLQLDSDLRRELFKDFFVVLNGFYTLDSDPPNPDADSTDTGIVFSLGWSCLEQSLLLGDGRPRSRGSGLLDGPSNSLRDQVRPPRPRLELGRREYQTERDGYPAPADLEQLATSRTCDGSVRAVLIRRRAMRDAQSVTRAERWARSGEAGRPVVPFLEPTPFVGRERGPPPRCGPDVSAAPVMRARSEFIEMPGLRLSVPQAARLWALDRLTSERLLELLVTTGFLWRSEAGAYERSSRP